MFDTRLGRYYWATYFLCPNNQTRIRSYTVTKGHSIHIGLNRVDPNHYQDQNGNPWDGTVVACEFDAKDMQALAQSQGF
jgi:hypothetical protein